MTGLEMNQITETVPYSSKIINVVTSITKVSHGRKHNSKHPLSTLITNQPTNQLHGAEFPPDRPRGPHLVEKFLAFYETRMFITAFTSARAC